MGDFDRDPPGRGDDPYARRRDQDERRTRGGESRRDQGIDRTSPPRRERPPVSDPATRSRGNREPSDQEMSGDRPPRRSERSRDDERPARYSDRFRRASAPPDEELDPRSYQSTRDPYDRLRTTARRQPRQVEPESYDDDRYFNYDEDDLDYESRGPAPRRRSNRGQAARVAQNQFRSVGASLANPSPEMRPILLGGILASASLIFLALVIAIRSGSAPVWIPLHLDAEGAPTVFGSKSTVWRLPVFALFTTIMALGLGWWLRIRERFAVQFLAVGALMVHGIVWVGVIRLLW